MNLIDKMIDYSNVIILTIVSIIMLVALFIHSINISHLKQLDEITEPQPYYERIVR